MCQLIEVTWLIWKLSTDQLIVLLDRDQCSISYFVPSLGSEHRKTATHIGHQCCYQFTAVKTRYPLTSITWPYRGLRCLPVEVKYFLEVIRWQRTGFQMIAGSSLMFNYCIWCLFFISNLMKSSVVYAAILFTHVCKIWDNDLTEYQVCYKLTDL